MQSNSNHICIDKEEMKAAYPQTQFIFFRNDYYYSANILASFIINTLPEMNMHDLEKVWRVCGTIPNDNINRSKLAVAFEPFNYRHSYDASFPIVIYTNDLKGHKNGDTGPIADFMIGIAQLISENLEEESSLQLIAKHDMTAERFYFDPDSNNLISSPLHDNQYISIKSPAGLEYLEDFLSAGTERVRANGKNDWALESYIRKTVSLLDKAGIQRPENLETVFKSNNTLTRQAGNTSTSLVDVADSLLNIIRMEKEINVKSKLPHLFTWHPKN